MEISGCTEFLALIGGILFKFSEKIVGGLINRNI